MAYRLGRFLQVLGLLIMPIGMAGNLLDKQAVTERHILMTLGIGALVFFIGHSMLGARRQ
jgi:hypothetical protein